MVVGVTNESESLVKKYIEQNKVAYTIAIEKSFKSSQAFGIDGYPSAFLIDPKGKVAWAGHPASMQPSDIEKVLAGARPPSFELPGPLKPVQPLIDKEDFGKAFETLKGLLGGPSLNEEQKKVAESMVSTIEKEATELFENSSKQIEEKDFYPAVTGLERLVRSYKGVHKTAEAEAKIKELRADPATGKEIDAGAKVAEGKRLEESKDYNKAYLVLRDAAVKFKGTHAAEAATAAADSIKSRSLLGYDKECENCRQFEMACTKHRKR